METLVAQLGVMLGSTFLAYYGTIEANKRRDTVITGSIDGVPIEKSHRMLILMNDWMPLKFSLSVISALGASGVMALSEHSGFFNLLPIEKLMVSFGAFGVIFFTIYGLLDFRYCLSVLRKAS